MKTMLISFFETLNTRGKDLQVSHLLKNLLSRMLKPTNKGLDPVRLKWSKLFATFESSQADIDVDEFLHHYWLSRAKYVAAKRLFVDMKQEIHPATSANQVLDDLLTDARIYRSIAEPPSRKWKKEELQIRRSLEALGIFRVRQPYPLVLSIMRAYIEGRISKKNTEALLAIIERFHFTFTAIASKSSSGGLSMMYASWARKLYLTKTPQDMQSNIKTIIHELTDRLPSLEDFMVGFSALGYSTERTKQRKLIRYILSRISEHYANCGVATDHEQMTIEHVASQRPQDSAGVSAESIEKVGNLLWIDVALQDKLSNKPFAEKRKILQSSSVAGVGSIIKCASWGDGEIRARTEELGRIAYSSMWK